MAVTVHRFNNVAKKLLNQEINLANIKAMLLNAAKTAAFDATNTTVDQVVGAAVAGHRANEVYGNGWTEGGEAVAATVSVRNTSGAALSFADARKTATGGNIGPAYGALYYDATNMAPLYLQDFGQMQTAGQDTDMLLRFDPNGTPGTVLTVT